MTEQYLQETEAQSTKSSVLLVPGFLQDAASASGVAQQFERYGYCVCIPKLGQVSPLRLLAAKPAREWLRQIHSADVAAVLTLLRKKKEQGQGSVYALAHSGGAYALVDALLIAAEQPEVYAQPEKIALVAPVGTAKPEQILTLGFKFVRQGLENRHDPVYRLFLAASTPLRKGMQSPLYHLAKALSFSGLSLEEKITQLTKKGKHVALFAACEDTLFPPSGLQQTARRCGAAFFEVPGGHPEFLLAVLQEYPRKIDAFFQSQM